MKSLVWFFWYVGTQRVEWLRKWIQVVGCHRCATLVECLNHATICLAMGYWDASMHGRIQAHSKVKNGLKHHQTSRLISSIA